MGTAVERHRARVEKGLIMRWHHRLAVALREWLQPSARDRELNEELQFHFDRQVQANLDAGMPLEQARRAAGLAIGNAEPIREASRDARAGALVRQFARDVTYGTRLLLKAPAFSLSAITIVAVGVASVTAIFSVVYGVLLRPLPFPEPDRLVQIWGHSPRYARDAVSAADRRDWEAENTVFEGIALYNALANFNLSDGDGEPERLLGARLSANSLKVLRVSPALGRGFAEGEDEIGRENVVILSDGLWRRRFGGDPGVVGRTIRLSGIPHEVIGVMPANFPYPEGPHDLWVPLTVNPLELTRQIPGFGLRSIARLKPGVSIAEAQGQMNVIATRLAGRHAMNRDVGIEVVGLQANLVGDVRAGLYVMFAAVGALLLVAALNLAGLLSARAAARHREIAVRLALGASRRRVVLQSVAEIVPVLLLGGGFGIGAAALAVGAFVPLAPARLPRVESIAIDQAVLLVALTVLVVAGVVAAALPAAQARGLDLALASRDGSRGSTGGPRHTRVRQALVVAQIALSLPLLTAAVLLTRSFTSVISVDPGFRTENIVSLHLAIPRSKYRSDEHIARFTAQLLDRVQSVPGVAAAAIVNRLPLSGFLQNVSVEFEDRPSESVLYGGRTISENYFSTMRIPLIEGRNFAAGDHSSAPVVVIIDERIARQRWPGESALGKRLRYPARGSAVKASPWMEVVGIAAHVKHEGLDVESLGLIYWDYRQRTQDRAVVVARTAADATATLATIIQRIRELDPEQPVYDARTLDEVLSRSVSQRWLAMALVGSFAVMALFLSCVGVYGVMAFGVSRQHREFGIRLALGATRRAVAGAVVSRGLTLAALGIVIGLVIAAAVTRGMQAFLFGVTASDFVSFAAATVAVMVVALLASYLPARAAASVDPAVTLRAE
jgi:putative ABC transport system permease protein